MKLTEKLKKFRNIALLSAAISTAATGCMTSSQVPWKTVESEYRPTGIERQVILETLPEKKETLEFDISEPYITEGEYEVKITESLGEVNSQVNTIGVENEFEKFLVEERKVNDIFPAFTVLGGLGGLIGGTYLGKTIDDAEFIFGLLGLGVGVLSGLELDSNFTREQTRTIKTDEIIQRLSSSRTTQRVAGDDVLVYQNQPASNILVRISGEGRYGMRTTNDEGRLNLSRFVDSLTPQYFFRNYTNEEIEDRIESIPLVQQIKPRTLENLMDDLVQAISPTELRLAVSTQEEPSEGREVINSVQRFNVEGNELTNKAIYGIVRQFVDEEINSNIKSLSFLVRDNVTHSPIDGSNFEFRLNAPRREDLAGEYFTQYLQDYAQEYIWNYLEGNTMIGDVPSKVAFNIYTPSMIQLEITNPDYHYVSGVINMDNENLEKEVYMVDKGEKIRVEDADNERGRIE